MQAERKCCSTHTLQNFNNNWADSKKSLDCPCSVTEQIMYNYVAWTCTHWNPHPANTVFTIGQQSHSLVVRWFIPQSLSICTAALTWLHGRHFPNREPKTVIVKKLAIVSLIFNFEFSHWISPKITVFLVPLQHANTVSETIILQIKERWRPRYAFLKSVTRKRETRKSVAVKKSPIMSPNL